MVVFLSRKVCRAFERVLTSVLKRQRVYGYQRDMRCRVYNEGDRLISGKDKVCRTICSICKKGPHGYEIMVGKKP